MAPDKTYIKGTIFTTSPGAEALAPILESLGISAFSVEDPADIAYVRGDFIDTSFAGGCPASEVLVSFWIEESGGNSSGMVTQLREKLLKLKGDEQYGVYGAGADFGRLWLETKVVQDDWKDKYKETFKAFSPADGVIITPPWESVTGGEETVIVIDPGMGFGTGAHETTAMCLEALMEAVKPGDFVLDAGTGSGILAITAALFGAGRVDAVEIDEDAAASAAGNIEANGVGDVVRLITGDLSEVTWAEEYDVIAANLTLGIVEKLAPVLFRAVKAGGTLIVSGILAEQEERILEVLENSGTNNGVNFRVSNVMRRGEWVMIEAVR